MTDSQALCSLWGWSNPPEDVIRMAEISSRCGGNEEGVLKELAVLDATTLARLASTKPGHMTFIEHAAEEQPAKVQPIVEKVVALAHGTPFYAQLRLLDAHMAMKSPSVVQRCRALDCVLMLVEGTRPVLVFSNHKSMVRFQIMGRHEREREPLVTEAGDAPLLAVGSRDDISAIISQADSSGDSYALKEDQVWHSASRETQESDAQRELARLLDHAIEAGASDIALRPNRDGTYRVRLRRYGILVSPRTAATWSQQMASEIIGVLLNKSHANESSTYFRSPRDGHISYRSSVGDAFLRVSFVPRNHHGDLVPRHSVSIRLFSYSEKRIDLDKLGLPIEAVSAIDDAVRMPAGLILFTGPMNSGKSTSVAGGLGRHAEIYGDKQKRVSVEDPIERYLPDLDQINVPAIIVKEGGKVVDDDERFTLILRGLKRHDIDVFWVGEIRDAETAEFCVSVATTGCLAFSTIHAKDTVLAMDVLSQWVPENKRFQLSEAVNLIVSQRLVPALCPACKRAHNPDEDDQRQWQRYMGIVGEELSLPELLYQAVSNAESGCEECDEGYIGYSVLCEVLPFDRTVRTAAGALVSRGGDVEAARRKMAEARKLTMVECARRRLAEGVVDLPSILYL